MSTQLATRAIPTTVCDGCGSETFVIFTDTHRRVVLDVEPVEGGVFTIDSHNRAIRRPLATMYREARAGRSRVRSYDVHDCHPDAWYER
jgi:hypothetical protein